MARVSMVVVAAAAVVLWGGPTRAGGDDHGGGNDRHGGDDHHGDDDCKLCGGVQLTPLAIGNAHCPFGGVQITTPTCSGDDKDKDKDKDKKKKKGDDKKKGGKGDHDQPPAAQVAFVCNGATGAQGSPGVQGPPGTPGTGGGSTTNNAYTDSNRIGVALPSSGTTGTLVAAVFLPPGNYVIEAKAQISLLGEGGGGEIDCAVHAVTADNDIDRQRTTVQGFATTALLGPFSTLTGDTVQLLCSTPAFVGGTVENAQLAAIQADNVFSSPSATKPTKR